MSIEKIVQVLGYRYRKVYYDYKKKEERELEESNQVEDLTKELRIEMPMTGSKKVYLDIKEKLALSGVKIGRDKVHKYLKEKDLLIKRSKKYVTTTDSYHRFTKHRNLIKGKDYTWPEQVFVNDITYIRVKETHAYLFLVTDAYSKKILGWTINYTMKVKDGKKAIKMASKNRKYKGQVIHHSDRGIQYCTPSYIKYIKRKGMIPSMTEELHVYENAIAERINGILKQEYGIDKGFGSLKEARSVIERSIWIYNNKRRHNSLHNLTPNFVHNNPGIKIKRWGSENKKMKQDS